MAETPHDNDDTEVDDEFRALLEGLRTTLPGVQLVTAFLLILPFEGGFADLVRPERVAYYVAFGAALTGTLLLMAPSSHQRMRAQPDGTVARQSRHHLTVAVRLSVAGSALFAVALAAVAFLVASLLLSTAVAVGVTAGVALVCAWSWYYLPLVAWRRSR